MRIGNAAHDQFQLDVYGEVMDSLHQARSHGLPADDHAWSLQRNLMDFLEGAWDRPDEGIWEVRGPRRHFTHSKVMAWVAFDRAVDTVERFDLPGPIDKWRQIRQTIHDEVCREALRHGAQLVHAVVRLRRARRVDPPDPARRLPAGRPTRGWPARSTRSSAT